MRKDTDIAIVTIEAAGPVVKDPLPKGNYSGGPWKIPVVYVLADGQRLDSRLRYSLKRDAVAEHALMPMAPKHPTEATFDDDGNFFGTRTSYWIGPRR